MMAVVKPAFWVMVWVFAVDHPSGAVTERAEFFRNRLPFMECEAKAKALTEFVAKQDHITTDGGTAQYSRVLCVPVAP